MELPEPVYEAILALFKGNATYRQCEELQIWLDACPQNKQLYEELSATLYITQWSANGQPIDTKADWNVVLQQYRKRKRSRYLRLSTAAASVLLLVGSIWFMTDRKGDRSLTIATEWPKEVVLITADGSKITLSPDRKGEITGDGTLFVSDSAHLIYRTNLNREAEESYHELLIPRGGEYRLSLPDGTEVVANAETRLRFPVEFSAEERHIYLEGEAYFYVKKDDRPFIVHTSLLDVKVLGTRFNLTAYGDEVNTVVTLVDGSVEVMSPGEENILAPGEQYTFNRLSSSGRVDQVNTGIYTSWTEGVFRFDAMPLEQMMKKLGRWFDLSYEFRDEQLKQKRFSGGFRKYDDVHTVLKLIEEYTDVSFRQTGETILIDKK